MNDEIVQRLNQKLIQWDELNKRFSQSYEVNQDVELDSKIKKRLRELGYID